MSIGYNLLYSRYESCIDVEIQQRAAEYLALSRRGEALVDILAEMPKFPERQVFALNLFIFIYLVYFSEDAYGFRL